MEARTLLCHVGTQRVCMLSSKPLTSQFFLLALRADAGRRGQELIQLPAQHGTCREAVVWTPLESGCNFSVLAYCVVTVLLDKNENTYFPSLWRVLMGKA